MAVWDSVPDFRHPEQVTAFPGASVSSQEEPSRYLRASRIHRDASELPRVLSEALP